MICRKTVLRVLSLCIVFAASAAAQPGDRHLNTEARVIDLLFPLDVTPNPYFLKMGLRFGDSETQLVVVVYPDKEKYWVRKCEITSYALEDMGKGQLSQLISKMVAENPNVKEQEIAAKLKVHITRSFIPLDGLNRALGELKAIRISPVLADRVAVDECSEYEFWYDTWQESVHYTITCPIGHEPQDQLGRWMVKFRANLPNLLEASSKSKP